MRFRFGTAVGLLLMVNFFTIPGSVPGFTSNEYAKQIGVLVTAVLLIAWLMRLKLGGRLSTAVLLTLFAFGAYASLTLTWSESVVESLRFIDKLWLTLALIVLVSAVRPSERPRLLRMTEMAMIAYMILTIIGELFLRDTLNPQRIGDPRLVGFGDIHGTKYLMSIVAVYGFAVGLVARRIRWMFVSAVGGVLVLLSLQRAIIGATVLAMAGITGLEVLRRRSLWMTLFAGLAIPAIALGGALAVFDYPPLRDRMFASETEAVLAQRLLISGRVPEVMALVQLRGRDEFWTVARELDVPLGGFGYGMAAKKIEDWTGQRWEVHNDFLKLRVETGDVGVVAYVVLLLVLISAAGFRAATSDDSRAALYLAAFGCLLIVPANGLFDNALDHVQKNLLYGTVFLLIGEGIESDSRATRIG